MSREAGLFVAVFLAAAVEAVEAATIVLAAGLSRGWRAALVGVSAGLLALAAVVAVLGPALTALPIDVLRVVVGGLLLIFGLQWLRKAILRASGFKALHDEDSIFARELEAARAADRSDGSIDAYGFTLSFKAVLLEGLEVAFIVVTFGGNQHAVPLAAAAAVAAVAVVAVAAALAHAPLSRVPENAIKFAVGVLLTAFGTFWGAEGAGAHWPGGDIAILVLIAATLLASLGMVAILAPTASRRAGHRPAAHMSRLRGVGAFLYDFVVGEDATVAVAVVAALALTAVVAGLGISAWWVLPIAVVGTLARTLKRAVPGPRARRVSSAVHRPSPRS